MDNFTKISLDFNGTSSSAEAMATLYGTEGLEENKGNFMSDDNELHLYLRITCLIFLSLIFTVGTIGNIMVTMVISFSRDMRTSTNIFLVNLSIADLLVLVICTPTALIEVTHHPDRWILGFYLCKFVPLLEATVANASVLTILAISFERYYAICRPLRANYVCTKSRAVFISIAAWVLASFITSPMIFMITYKEGRNEREEWTARCEIPSTMFADCYTISTIILFFLVPFICLIILYGIIANRLTMDRSGLNAKNENHKARKQVVIMLGTVVFTFFLSLFPFRVLSILVIMVDGQALSNHLDAYHNFLYFSRIMVYLNSSLNPILYNVMSSKFRNGFLRLCYRRKKPSPFTRNGTFITNTTTTNSTNMSINLGHQPGLPISCNGKGSGQNSPELNGSPLKRNGVTKIDGKTLKNYLLSQSHSHSPNNGFLLNSHRSPTGVALYNGGGTGVTHHHSYYPFQETPSCSPGFRNASTKIHNNISKGISSNNNCNNGNFIGPLAVKSDVVFSAYIPGRRSETVL